MDRLPRGHPLSDSADSRRLTVVWLVSCSKGAMKLCNGQPMSLSCWTHGTTSMTTRFRAEGRVVDVDRTLEALTRPHRGGRRKRGNESTNVRNWRHMEA